jgi:hypothetical protein
MQRALRTMGCGLSAVAVTLAAALSLAQTASAEDDAVRVLQAMSNYVASQKTISATFDSDVEVITPDLQKIQFTSSGQVLLSRPDKIRATRIGGYTDVELVFDGKTLSFLGKHRNAYAQLEAPGTVDQLIDVLQNKYGAVMPGADLLLSKSYDELTADVTAAMHIGQGVVDGVECEHLAFRAHETDWQIWIEVGARPIPRKYVITSKTMAGAPQYTLRIKDWKTDVAAGADAFAFNPPSGATKIALDAIRDFDEIPPGVVAGAEK